MRSHGDPTQADPVINSDGDIEITMTNVSQALSQQAHDSSGPCGHYLTAASTALRGGQPAPTGPDQAQLLRYAECMRANGVPKYPDPNGSGETNLNDIGMDPNSPTFKNADTVCSKESGIPGPDAPPPPGVVQVTSCNAPAGRQCPSGGPAAGGGRRPAPSGNGGSGGNG